MNFAELFIKRPAFTIVLSLIITIVGIVSYKSLQVRWIPNVTPPIVSVNTQYPGASANLVETQITTPMENALAGVDGVESVYSSSRQNESNITLTFKLGHNINAAVEDVHSALQSATSMLPDDVKTPEVYKMDMNGSPIMYLAFFDSQRSNSEVSDYVKHFVMPELQSVDGVASVRTFGQRDFAMHVWVDPMKMAAANVTIDDVTEVLKNENVQVPSGQIRSRDRFYSVVTNQSLHSAAEFNDLIIRSNQGQMVRIKDIGQATVDAENADSAFRANGVTAVALAIIPQSTANPLSVADKVKKQFTQISKTLPQGMQAKILYNEATFIHSSIDNVYESLVEAIIFVLAVILLFLASWRAALIPIVTIPICLISAFAILFAFGFSINTITLMAFVLAIGLVVDDAIVMLENVTRYIEKGMQPFAAAIKGSREIIFPIIAMTFTLAAAYVSIAFTTGLLGAVFKEFAATLAGTVLISGFVAVTLSPMMCSRLLVQQKKDSRYANWLSEKFLLLQQRYAELLTKIFARKKWVIFALAGIVLAGAVVYHFTPSELAPTEDMGEVYIGINAPHDASFQYTDSYARYLESIYKKIPEVESQGSSIGYGSSGNGFQFLELLPRDKRSRSASEIAQALSAQVKSLPGVNAGVFTPPSPLAWYSDGNGSSIDMNIMSSMDYKSLHSVMQRLVNEVKKYPGFLNVDSQLKWDGEQFEVHIDREKASVMQVPMQNITNTISAFLAGKNVGYFEYDNNQYNIIVKMNQSALANPNIVSQLYVRNANNKMVPISGLVTMRDTTNPTDLPHYDRLRNDTLFATLAPGYTLGEAIQFLQKTAKEILPDNAKYTFQGQAHDYLESTGNSAFIYLLAVLFIYLVLVAQFESFVDPLIILLTVPFAVIGAIVTLKITGCTLNIYSNIGLVTLIGLIAKHGILITEFANKKYASGMSLHAAVIEAATLRLRPILMTTAAMVLGALPLALATGSGAESRQQIGWVIVGGLLLGTFFSLIVVPVTYLYLARFKKVDMSPEYWNKIYKELDENKKELEC